MRVYLNNFLFCRLNKTAISIRNTIYFCKSKQNCLKSHTISNHIISNLYYMQTHKIVRGGEGFRTTLNRKQSLKMSKLFFSCTSAGTPTCTCTGLLNKVKIKITIITLFIFLLITFLLDILIMNMYMHNLLLLQHSIQHFHSSVIVFFRRMYVI